MNLERLKPSPYSEKEWEQEIQRLTAQILAVSEPLAIAVFGSSVQWERHAASDIDLAVLFETPEQAKAGAKKILSSRPTRDIPVDWLFFDKDQYLKSHAQGSIGWIIHEHGRFLYGEDPAK